MLQLKNLASENIEGSFKMYILTINNGPTTMIKDKFAWKTNIEMEIQSPYHVPRKQADGVDMCLSSPQPSVSLHAPGDKWWKGKAE